MKGMMKRRGGGGLKCATIDYRLYIQTSSDHTKSSNHNSSFDPTTSIVRDAAAAYGALTGGFCGCMAPTRPMSFSSTDHDAPKDSPECVDHHRCDALQQLPHCIHTRIVLTPP